MWMRSRERGVRERAYFASERVKRRRPAAITEQAETGERDRGGQRDHHRLRDLILTRRCW